jgi:hypothetical protein
VLLVVLLSAAGGMAHPWWYELLLVGYELTVGAAIGYAVGAAGRPPLGEGRGADLIPHGLRALVPASARRGIRRAIGRER